MRVRILLLAGLLTTVAFASTGSAMDCLFGNGGPGPNVCLLYYNEQDTGWQCDTDTNGNPYCDEDASTANCPVIVIAEGACQSTSSHASETTKQNGDHYSSHSTSRTTVAELCCIRFLYLRFDQSETAGSNEGPLGTRDYASSDTEAYAAGIAMGQWHDSLQDSGTSSYGYDHRLTGIKAGGVEAGQFVDEGTCTMGTSVVAVACGPVPVVPAAPELPDFPQPPL